MTPAYLSPTEAAELLGVSRDVVRDAINRGDLPAVRLGHRTLRIARHDFDAWLTARAVAAPRRRLRRTA